MITLNKVHHIAIIAGDYSKSKHFYIDILGLTIIQEIYRENRDSYKLDLALNGNFIIELFSFPNPPKRVSGPEAAGLRHLAFEVNNIQETRKYILEQGCDAEEIRIDEFTDKKFFFMADPDNTPIEFYEK
ncbi:VOC family protein [Flavobacterium sp. M31R6]|uniref:SMU1112c/YaeR family gloxylase I-like metalloprotein n=1 Tax=Flavobacterium sp. M31R6 TaxID=2739062 RepID=UPI001568093B|nr:VOC family protein [Flavobacterium sp. M31R6]QKJ64423.1 VOC family protein [Flavobacterium sp. M31R6]